MATLAKLTWVELKLFAREPVTMFFTFALPLIFLFVMGEVFGNTPEPDEDVFRRVGPMNYYTPAYIALVMSAIGLVSLPVHLAGYRERGVLRRLRASSVSLWAVFGSQVIVSFVIAALCAVLLTTAAVFAYDVSLPRSVGWILPAFVLGTLCFAAVGVFLGALLPTGRAAQGAGLPLFFVMMLVAGAGPPPEVMTEAMQWIGDITPLRHVILLLQDPWLGLGWNWTASLIVVGFTVVAAAVSARVFRWE